MERTQDSLKRKIMSGVVGVRSGRVGWGSPTQWTMEIGLQPDNGNRVTFSLLHIYIHAVLSGPLNPCNDASMVNMFGAVTR